MVQQTRTSVVSVIPAKERQPGENRGGIQNPVETPFQQE